MAKYNISHRAFRRIINILRERETRVSLFFYDEFYGTLYISRIEN